VTEDFFDIGSIVNVHGLRGEIRVLPSTEDPSRFELLKTIEVFFPENRRGSEDSEGTAESAERNSDIYVLESTRRHKTVVVLKLVGIDDRNAAGKLIGGVIKIPRSMALPLDDDEYYQKDLLDMTVVTDEGEELGTLVQILETGANDVYVIRSKEEIKDLLIPAIKDCILSVDIAEKKMTVHLMKGLREL
jgi:16S rRNA processing protein RimM